MTKPALVVTIVLAVIAGWLMGHDSGALDLAWTEAFYHWCNQAGNERVLWFFEFYSQDYGGQILTNLMIAAAVIILIWACRQLWQGRNDARVRLMLRAAGFIVLATLIMGITSRGLKGGIARPRPQYQKDTARYTPWYDWTSRKSRDPWTMGSFPSGHTMQATLVFALLYLLKYFKPELARKKTVIFMLIGFCLTFVILIGLSRVALSRHWFGDVIFGGFIGIWIVMLSARLTLGQIGRGKAT